MAYLETGNKICVTLYSNAEKLRNGAIDFI